MRTPKGAIEFNGFMAKLLRLLPAAVVEEDREGQVVIYTGMKMAKIEALVPMDEYDDKEL